MANRVARRSVVAPWRDGGQSQFIERPVPEPGDAGTAATRAWALERLGEPLTLADLAGHARMSVRTFTRRFRRGDRDVSPQRWLVQQRVALARQLLESTDTPGRAGRRRRPASARTASLRQHLHAAIGVAPLAYRRTYRGTASLTRCDAATPRRRTSAGRIVWLSGDVPAPPSLIRSGRNRRRAEAAPPRCARLSDVSPTM